MLKNIDEDQNHAHSTKADIEHQEMTIVHYFYHLQVNQWSS